jgi:hypothetical protein
LPCVGSMQIPSRNNSITNVFGVTLSLILSG